LGNVSALFFLALVICAGGLFSFLQRGPVFFLFLLFTASLWSVCFALYSHFDKVTLSFFFFSLVFVFLSLGAFSCFSPFLFPSSGGLVGSDVKAYLMFPTLTHLRSGIVTNILIFFFEVLSGQGAYSLFSFFF